MRSLLNSQKRISYLLKIIVFVSVVDFFVVSHVGSLKKKDVIYVI